MSDQGDLRRVLIVGAGRTGGLFVTRCLQAGLEVVVHDIDPQALQRSGQVPSDEGTPALGPAAQAQLTVETDPVRAAAGVDLLIECVPERLALKRSIFAQFAALCPSTALFVTNTSVLLPSHLAAATQRPERFAAFHLLNETGLVEIMGHAGTAPATLDTLARFARRLGCLPILCRKELPGYLFNTLTMPWFFAALKLAAQGAASVSDIDRLWMRAMHTPRGPFGELDRIGLDTVCEITRYFAQRSTDPDLAAVVAFLEGYVQQGRKGAKVARGFYDYPQPAYEQPGFVEDEFTCPTSPAVDVPASADALLDQWEQLDDHQATVTLMLDPQRDGLLRDHVYKDTPLLPAAGMLEWCLEALEHLTSSPRRWQLSDVQFLNGVRCFTPAPQRLRLHLERTPGQARWSCRCTQEFRNRKGELVDPQRLWATAWACPLTASLPDVAWTTFAKMSGNWHELEYSQAGAHRLGPSLQALRRICLGAQSGWGVIERRVTPALRDRPQPQWRLPPDILDAALVACNVWLQQQQPGWIQLPQSIAQLEFGDPAPAGTQFLVAFVVEAWERDSATYRLLLCDAAGCLLWRVRGYRCVLVRDGSAPPVRLGAVAPVEAIPTRLPVWSDGSG